MVKAALEEAEKAQNAAEKAIKQADEDIKGTQDLLTSVSPLSVFLKITETAPSLMLRNWCKPVLGKPLGTAKQRLQLKCI